ncbi:MAG: AAA family ATPase [Sulfurovum sp.]|nr:AAA family ATPase [Sulfurovum sp.]
MQEEEKDHFIKNIEIKNFKCFNDFKAEGFGRVNLIGGKNNVGKTAFMEATWINTYSRNTNGFFTSVWAIAYMRDNMELICKDCSFLNKQLFERTKSYFSKSNINTVNYELLNKDGKQEYCFNINNKETIINVNSFSYQSEEISNIKYIDNFGYTNNQLKEAFEAVQKRDTEEILYQYINDFDSNISNFKIIGGDKPQCKIHNGNYMDLNEFGDGLKHWISIICSLYASKDGYLFIDEIDNGIHYTNLDKLWEIILTSSKKQNVQVFATTHSKECIESYARVAKRLEDEEITFVELGRNKKDELDSVVMDSEMFQRFIALGNEVRGW